MIRGFLVVLSQMLFSFAALAEGIDASVIEKIQQARLELKNNMGAVPTCTLPSSPSCSGTEYCKELEKNADKAIIYKNDQGETVPNFALQKFNHDFEGCFDVAAVDVSDDPLLNIETLQSAKAAGGPQAFLQNHKEWEAANNKAKPILEETRRGILNILDARKNGSNDAAIEDMKKRILAIRLATTQEVQSKGLENKCALPNARFMRDDHSVHLCPQLLRMPAASLQMILAHEMAHAIDPCNAAKDLYSDGKVTSNQATRLPTEVASIAKAGKMISAGTSLQKNPFSSVISCLQQPNSMSLPLPETLPTWEEYRACSEVSESALMQEGFADWMASQVLKNKVASIKNPEAAKRFAFESQALFFAAGCDNISQRVLNAMTVKLEKNEEQTVKDRCRDLAAMQGDAKHPRSDKRVGRLFLTPKEMQKALNCKPTDAVECK